MNALRDAITRLPLSARFEGENKHRALVFVALSEWAQTRGLSLRTAQRMADDGRLDGSDEAHPLASQLPNGRWLVAPRAYLRPVEAEPAQTDERDIEALRALADAVEALARAAKALRQGR